jgi:glutamyl-tRNA reductase
MLCNRTLTTAWVGDEPVHSIDRLPELLADADAAVVCTAAPLPVITRNRLGPRIGGAPILLVDLGIPAQVDPCLPADVAEIADLEVLQQVSGRRVVASWADLAHVRSLVNASITEFERFCQERRWSQLLRRTQERHQRYVKVDIPKVLDEVAPDLPPGLRSRLESELKGLVRSYTNAVFRDIREMLGQKEDDR